MPDWTEMVVDAKDVIALPASMAALPGEDQVEDVSGTAVAAVSIAPADLEKIETVLVVAVAADVLDTAMQILAAQRDNPTLTPAEIEQIVNDARWFVLRALAKNRSAWGSVRARPITEPLKSTAKHIQDLGLAIISLRPPLIERRTTGAGNLHLIAHAWYGDYSRAAELLRLNPQIRNPNDIRPGEVLNAYAE